MSSELWTLGSSTDSCISSCFVSAHELSFFRLRCNYSQWLQYYFYFKWLSDKKHCRPSYPIALSWAGEVWKEHYKNITWSNPYQDSNGSTNGSSMARSFDDRMETNVYVSPITTGNRDMSLRAGQLMYTSYCFLLKCLSSFWYYSKGIVRYGLVSGARVCHFWK